MGKALKLNAAETTPSRLKNNPVTRFVKGFLCPFQSFKFIRQNPPLYKFVIFPFLINVFTFSSVVYYSSGYFQNQVMSRIPQGDAWYWMILNYLIIVLAVLLVLVLVFFTFAVVGSLLASPFNDVLSEKTELLLTDSRPDEPFTVAGFVKDVVQSLVVESKKIGLFLLGMLFILLLLLVPVLGSIAYSVLSVCWTILFLVFEYTGYVFSRKKLNFKEQRGVVFRNGSLMLGFGTGMFCVLAIPFFQFLCIPLGVVGAVRLLHEAGELSVGSSEG